MDITSRLENLAYWEKITRNWETIHNTNHPTVSADYCEKCASAFHFRYCAYEAGRIQSKIDDIRYKMAKALA